MWQLSQECKGTLLTRVSAKLSPPDSATIGDGTYADSLDLLYSCNLMDSVLASGTKDGYTFTVSTDAENDSFAVYARPITYTNQNSRLSSTRSFFSDETGVIRYTAEGRPATVDDKPLGQ